MRHNGEGQKINGKYDIIPYTQHGPLRNVPTLYLPPWLLSTSSNFCRGSRTLSELRNPSVIRFSA